MTPKLKILLISVAAVLVVLIGALVVIRLSLESMIVAGVETLAPKVTGVKVEIASMKLVLRRGELKLKGFTLGDPKGYEMPFAVKAGRVFVKIQPLSLLSGKIIVDKIEIDGVDVNYEQGLTSSNMLEVKANVDAFAKTLSNASSSQGKPEAKAPEASKAPEAKGGKKLQVDSVEIRNVKVSVTAKGLSSAATVPVPDIKLQALGSGPEGITLGDLIVKIMDALLNGVMDACKSILPSLSNVADGVGKAASGAVDGAKGVVDGVINIFK